MITTDTCCGCTSLRNGCFIVITFLIAIQTFTGILIGGAIVEEETDNRVWIALVFWVIESLGIVALIIGIVKDIKICVLYHLATQGIIKAFAILYIIVLLISYLLHNDRNIFIFTNFLHSVFLLILAVMVITLLALVYMFIVVFSFYTTMTLYSLSTINVIGQRY